MLHISEDAVGHCSPGTLLAVARIKLQVPSLSSSKSYKTDNSGHLTPSKITPAKEKW